MLKMQIESNVKVCKPVKSSSVKAVYNSCYDFWDVFGDLLLWRDDRDLADAPARVVAHRDVCCGVRKTMAVAVGS